MLAGIPEEIPGLPKTLGLDWKSIRFAELDLEKKLNGLRREENEGAKAFALGDAMGLLRTPQQQARDDRKFEEALKSNGNPQENPGLSKAERAILTALAQYTGPIEHKRLAVLAGYSHSGGAFVGALANLRGAGYLVGSKRDGYELQPRGRQALGTYEKLPTGHALIAYWLRRLSKDAERRTLDALQVAHPAGFTLEELARVAGYEPKGGAFVGALAKLRKLQLIEGDRHGLRLRKDIGS